MLGTFLTIAQVDGVRDFLGQPPRAGGGFDSTDTILILAFVFLLAVALFSWAYFIRKRPEDRMGGRVLTRTPKSSRKRQRRSSESHSHSHSEAEAEAEEDTSNRRRVRRRRRRSEEHMRRNPTLEETGGLPPPRPDDDGGHSGSTSGPSTGPQV